MSIKKNYFAIAFGIFILSTDSSVVQSQTHDPFSSLIPSAESEVSEKATPIQKKTKSNDQVSGADTPNTVQVLQTTPILEGIVISSEGKYAHLKLGALFYFVKEGEYLQDKQVISIRSRSIILLDQNKQLILHLKEKKD